MFFEEAPRAVTACRFVTGSYEVAEMDDSLIRRADDLAARCVRTGSITHSGFLTPAESAALTSHFGRGQDIQLLLHGGYAGAERCVAFFLPDWMDAVDFDPAEYICAADGVAAFGAPGHRDWLGSVLGLGLGREWIGDILLDGSHAILLCLPSVQAHILGSLERVGRCSVKLRPLPLSEIVPPERLLEERSFSVGSPRLDAVCAGTFRISRTAAVQAIAVGALSLNYTACLKPDAPVRSGDVLSLHGKGKAVVLDVGSAVSKKGRQFIHIGIYR